MTLTDGIRLRCDYCGKVSEWVDNYDILRDAGWIHYLRERQSEGISNLAASLFSVPYPEGYFTGFDFCSEAHREAWVDNGQKSIAASAGNEPMLGSNNGRGIE